LAQREGASDVNIILSNSGEQPIYDQISSQIKSAIMKGELSGGDPLPSIRSLAKELQISVMTTKRAYDELEAANYIETIPGKGSYVAGGNKELMKESRIRMIEEKLMEAILTAKLVGLELEDLQGMLTLLFEED